MNILCVDLCCLVLICSCVHDDYVIFVNISELKLIFMMIMLLVSCSILYLCSSYHDEHKYVI